MTELRLKSKQSGSTALDNDATLPLKKLKTLILH